MSTPASSESSAPGRRSDAQSSRSLSSPSCSFRRVECRRGPVREGVVGEGGVGGKLGLPWQRSRGANGPGASAGHVEAAMASSARGRTHLHPKLHRRLLRGRRVGRVSSAGASTGLMQRRCGHRSGAGGTVAREVGCAERALEAAVLGRRGARATRRGRLGRVELRGARRRAASWPGAWHRPDGRRHRLRQRGRLGGRAGDVDGRRGLRLPRCRRAALRQWRRRQRWGERRGERCRRRGHRDRPGRRVRRHRRGRWRRDGQTRGRRTGRRGWRCTWDRGRRGRGVLSATTAGAVAGPGGATGVIGRCSVALQARQVE